MSMQDSIADMLTRIRNAHAVSHAEVSVISSNIVLGVAKVLKDEGYIVEYENTRENSASTLKITLKYYEGRPVIESLQRISRPGLRIYKGKNDLPQVKNGLGIAIISTSQGGVMSDREARRLGIGGEILCYVS